MRTTWIVVVFIALVLSSTHGLAIIDGRFCDEDEFPASLELIEILPKDQFAYFCGATLIAPDVAITAAHCIEKILKPDGQKAMYYLSSRVSNFSLIDENNLPVKGILIHPQYTFLKGEGPHHDLALIFLAQTSSIKPAVLLTPQEGGLLREGLSSYIVGWGQEQIGKSGQKKSSGKKSCSDSFINHVHDSEIQLGSTIHSSRKCFGDSGGATYLPIPSEAIGEVPRIRLAGVTSHLSPNDLECKKGALDTRIDVYYSWIISSMQKTCDEGFRISC